MPSLDLAQRCVETLYHQVVVNNILEDEEEDFFEDESCNFLKDRIKKNLRQILCDVVLLNYYQGDTVLESDLMPDVVCKE